MAKVGTHKAAPKPTKSASAGVRRTMKPVSGSVTPGSTSTSPMQGGTGANKPGTC